MPPKKQKNVDKGKQKSVEDKTFGLKNKNKSSKVQKHIQQVQQQAKDAGKSKAAKRAEEANSMSSKKRAAQAKQDDMDLLFKPIAVQQKVPFGVDPKTVLCQFFKAGTCQKGTRCKFSHDANVERKVAKRDLYADDRDTKEADTMDQWDQEKLESVVKSKQTKANMNNPTEIVCKYFLEALETEKYGWFWNCQNGDSCKYRHALPPGYVLKKKETEEERREREEREKENEISIEEFLETERYNLGSNLTPITYETFNKWKAERVKKKAEEELSEQKRRKDAYTSKKDKSGLGFSGKELFDFNPEWADDKGDDDGAMEMYEREASDNEDESQQQSAQGSSSSVAQSSSKMPSSSSVGGSWEVVGDAQDITSAQSSSKQSVNEDPEDLGLDDLGLDDDLDDD